jgi:hypothetical protein
VYASSSSALATGSALTFDGSTLSNSTSGTPFSLNRTGAGTAHIELKQSGTTGAYLGTSGVNDFIIFNGSAAELARFNATGLGIGTSSPQSPLQVRATARPQLAVSYDGITGLYLEDSSNSFGKSWKLSGSGAINSQLEFFQSTATSGVPVWPSTAAMTLDPNQNLLVGIATANANGGVLQLKSGITFPATAVAATNANTLDDYEEGTYGSSSANGILTPSTSGSITCASDFSCSYTKIGRQVVCQGLITVSSVSSPVGFIQIALPFAQLSATNALGCGTFISADIDLPTGAVSNGLTSQTGNVTFCWPRVSVDNASYANVNSALLIVGSQIQFTFSFITS